MPRVFIIGWDGATFDLIRPWAAEGKLPTLARLMAAGATGPLQSTLPPMTFPAWSSFLTGKNPGKHGIFDFTRQRPGSYDLEFVNGGHRHGDSFWRLLSDAGRKVISISVPCTYPPEAVNGIMISGFDAAGLAGERQYIDRRGAYPPDLDAELRRESGPHPIGAFVADDLNRGRPEAALGRMLATIGQKAATAKYLMSRYSWDCFMILFGESDGAGHHFWRYCDPRSPLFEDGFPGMRDAILRVYQELDRQAGELLQQVPGDTVVLMMSDHGFGGVGDEVLYPNRWLHERGLLQFRGAAFGQMSRALNAVKMWCVGRLPPRLKRLAAWLARGRLGGVEGAVRFGAIDWSGTRAYFDENPYYPALWINLRGRQPKGTVEPGEHYEALRGQLIADLESWRHPATGQRIVVKAWRREVLYEGSRVAEAPDIIPQWDTNGGYSYAFKLSSLSAKRAWMEQCDPHQPSSFRFFTGKSGHHREEGIFVACGPGVRAGAAVEGARITDLAPSILALQGVAVPPDMDGRVLHEAFAAVPVAEAPPLAAAADDGRQTPHAGYTAADEALIAARLRSLGYLE